MKGIFIIEDDESLRRELAYVLELEGYSVSTCNEFSHAAEDALGKKPDTIVLDLRLPGADGLAICRRIRENSNVPILVLTSSNEKFDEVMSMKLGADGYLLKPIVRPSSSPISPGSLNGRTEAAAVA